MKRTDKFNLKAVKKAILLMHNKKYMYLSCIVIFCIVELVYTVLDSFGIRGVVNSLSYKDTKMFWYSMSFIIAKNILWCFYAPISSYLCGKASINTMREYKSNFCEHILRLPMSYLDKKSKGDYMTLLTTDMEGLKTMYDRSLFQVLHSLTGGIGGIIIMLIIDCKFAAVVIAFGFLSILTSSMFSERLKKISDKRQQNLNKSNTDIYELVKAAKTIRVLKCEEKRKEQMEKTLEDEKDIRNQFADSVSKMKSYELLISRLSYIALLIAGALFVYFDLADWGSVTALIGLKYITDMLFVECGQFVSLMQKDIASVERLDNAQRFEKEKLQSDSYIFKTQDNALSLKNISFGYKEDYLLINNFSLELPGKCFAVFTGKSGSGKSTLMKLLMAFYEPMSGSIEFKGICHADLYSVRQKSAYVPQDAMLFNASVYDNIKLGNKNADFKDIIRASKLAGAHDFINNLKGKYDYVLNDDGNNLSGGQKKRIALARALVKDSDILILDEITSALDYKTEEQILETIKNISRQKTVLFVSHNENIIKYADMTVNI